MSWYECDSLPQSFNVVDQGRSCLIQEENNGPEITLKVGNGGLLLVKRSPSPAPSSCSPPPPPSHETSYRPLHHPLEHPYEAVRRAAERPIKSTGYTVLCHPHIPTVVLDYLSFDEQKQFRILSSASRDSANAFFQASAFECAFNLIKWGKFSPSVAPLDLRHENTPARALGFFDRIASLPEQADFVFQLQDALKRPFYLFSNVIVPDSEKFLRGYDCTKHRPNYVRFSSPEGEPWLTIGRAETLEVSYENKENTVHCIIVPGMKRIPNCLFSNSNLSCIKFENAQEITQIGHRFLMNSRVQIMDDVDLQAFSNVHTIGRMFLAGTNISNFHLPYGFGFGVSQIGNGFLTKCSSLSFVDLSSLVGLKTTRKWFCHGWNRLDGASDFALPDGCRSYHPAAVAVDDWVTRKEEAEARRRRGRR